MSRWGKLRAAVAGPKVNTDGEITQNGVSGTETGAAALGRRFQDIVSVFTGLHKKQKPEWMTPIGSYVGESKWNRDRRVHPDAKQRAKCCVNGTIFFNALKAMISRQLFLLHALLAVWRVAVVKGPSHWILTLLLLPILVEALYVLFARQAKEWKWLSPSIFFYLVNIVPCVWLLELDKSYQLLAESTGAAGNTTVVVAQGGLDLSSDEWTAAIEQATLVLVVIGRWLMPRGELTRDQLSALLVTYIGIASDIVDFYNILTEDRRLRQDLVFVSVVLGCWSWSLIQFCFVITATKEEEDTNDNIKTKKTLRQRVTSRLVTLVESGAWATCISLFMQDGPFLIVRLVCMFHYRVVTYTLYFFVAKNALVMLINIYRIIVLHVESKEERLRQLEKKKPYRDLYKNTFLYK